MAEQEDNLLQQLIDWVFGWKVSFDPAAGARWMAGCGRVRRARCRRRRRVLHLVELERHQRPPRVPWLLARFKRRALPAAPAGHLTIAVAHLDNDKDREHETLLLDELRQFEGVEAVSVDRTVDPEQPDKKIAEEEARGLLKQTGADVLVWGSVSKSAMRLFWTPAQDAPGAASTGKISA